MAATTNSVNPNLPPTIVSPATTATATSSATATAAVGRGGANISDSNSASSSNQSRRASSPWTQVVRGESESIASIPTSPSASQSTATVVEQPTEDESLENGSSNAGKKPVWNKPSNGAVEVGPVMGAHSWPALSEGARGSSAKSSSESLKGLSDGSSSAPVSQAGGPVNSSSQKQVTSNGGVNITPNHTVPARQRSMKRNGPGPSSNSGHSQPPAQQGPVTEPPLNNPSPRDHTQRGSGGGGHGHDHHPQQRFPFRNNRNGGSHPRGDGSHHHQNYGGRRDHDRGNQDWHAHRNFNGRDGHMQPPQRVMQRFMRHPPPQQPLPPSSAPYITPPAVRPFGAPLAFPELAPQQFYYVPTAHPEMRMPFVGAVPPHTVFFPAMDPQLPSKIVNQIDYYFSNDNLIKDIYLRQNMDDQGWVSVKLIAGFNKVTALTDNVSLILEALRGSSIVEIQGDKIRRRNDWKRWLMPPVLQSKASNTQYQRQSSQDKLVNQVQNLSLDPRSANHSRSSSGDFSNQSQKSSSSQVNVQGHSDRSVSARNVKDSGSEVKEGSA